MDVGDLCATRRGLRSHAPTLRSCADAKFVGGWAGEHGETLTHLELFERSLDVKRTIAAQDVEALSRIKFLEGPIFIPAMVKAMMTSPPENATTSGESTLFSTTDFGAVGPTGKLRAKAVRAAKVMMSVREFAQEFCHCHTSKVAKHISTLDVRLVMHMICSWRDCRRPAGGVGVMQ